MNHKQKVRLARQLLTPEERKDKVNKFDSKAWQARAKAIRERVIRQEIKIKKK